MFFFLRLFAHLLLFFDYCQSLFNPRATLNLSHWPCTCPVVIAHVIVLDLMFIVRVTVSVVVLVSCACLVIVFSLSSFLSLFLFLFLILSPSI